LLMRSTMNAPATMSKTAHAHGRSASAPHQLCPGPKIGTATSSASAAGLNTCHRRVAKMCFESVARTPMVAMTIHGVTGASTKPTIMPDRMADDGLAARHVWLAYDTLAPAGAKFT